MIFVALSVQKEGREVEVACEQHPQTVGDLQISRGLISAVEAQRHDYDEDIEQHDPDEREEPPLEREEQDRPDQVDDELGVVDGLGILCREPVPFQNAVRDTHQGVQDAPRDGEEDRRGRERGLVELVVVHRARGQQSHDGAEDQRYEDGYGVGFDFFLVDSDGHSNSPYLIYEYYMPDKGDLYKAVRFQCHKT